jgi:hypothetical protein
VCAASGGSCGVTQCVQGSCGGGTCGGLGQACCLPSGGGPGTCTAPYTRCLGSGSSQSSYCVACGGKDQRACVDSTPNGFRYVCLPGFRVDVDNNIAFCRP